MPKFLSIAIVWLALVAPAKAQTQALPTTDILLVLAVDTSGSVNQTRFELQRRGYADAFRSQQVLNAIRGGSTGSIAVTIVQWTGPAMQVQVVPWTLIKDEGSASAFADAIEAAPRQLFGGGTSLSGAIDHAMLLLASAPYRGLKRVIDISGDGSNNRGRDVREARDEAVRAGVIINGLPIVSLEYDLDKYYFNNVIGGPGSFIVPGHDSRLGQVIDNLIENARSFSPPDGTVRITAKRLRNAVEITADDDGPGIQPELMERIFERFYTDRPSQNFGQNSGLGLSISRQIVEAHGGRIRAENRMGVATGPDGPRVLGARFVVRLPARRA